MGGAYGPSGLNAMLPLNYILFINTQFPFIATLEFPNFTKLMNDPILHHPAWPLVPFKIPIDIPKFDGKSREEPTNHITPFHLWCVSNFMLDDSIKLWLFPCTLTGNASEWFIKLPTTSFSDFSTLAIDFLTHFQLPIKYKIGTYFLASLRQNTTTYFQSHPQMEVVKKTHQSPNP